MDSKKHIIEGLSIKEYYIVMLIATLAKEAAYLSEDEKELSRLLVEFPVYKRIADLQDSGLDVSVRRPWGA